MRCATVIATCLVNSSIVDHQEDAERIVWHVFEDEFPGHSFALWNVDVPSDIAVHIIKTVGRAM